MATLEFYEDSPRRHNSALRKNLDDSNDCTCCGCFGPCRCCKKEKKSVESKLSNARTVEEKPGDGRVNTLRLRRGANDPQISGTSESTEEQILTQNRYYVVVDGVLNCDPKTIMKDLIEMELAMDVLGGSMNSVMSDSSLVNVPDDINVHRLQSSKQIEDVPYVDAKDDEETSEGYIRISKKDFESQPSTSREYVSTTSSSMQKEQIKEVIEEIKIKKQERKPHAEQPVKAPEEERIQGEEQKQEQMLGQEPEQEESKTRVCCCCVKKKKNKMENTEQVSGKNTQKSRKDSESVSSSQNIEASQKKSQSCSCCKKKNKKDKKEPCSQSGSSYTEGTERHPTEKAEESTTNRETLSDSEEASRIMDDGVDQEKKKNESKSCSCCPCKKKEDAKKDIEEMFPSQISVSYTVSSEHTSVDDDNSESKPTMYVSREPKTKPMYGQEFVSSKGSAHEPKITGNLKKYHEKVEKERQNQNVILTRIRKRILAEGSTEEEDEIPMTILNSQLNNNNENEDYNIQNQMETLYNFLLHDKTYGIDSPFFNNCRDQICSSIESTQKHNPEYLLNVMTVICMMFILLLSKKYFFKKEN